MYSLKDDCSFWKRLVHFFQGYCIEAPLAKDEDADISLYSFTCAKLTGADYLSFARAFHLERVYLCFYGVHDTSRDLRDSLYRLRDSRFAKLSDAHQTSYYCSLPQKEILEAFALLEERGIAVDEIALQSPYATWENFLACENGDVAMIPEDLQIDKIVLLSCQANGRASVVVDPTLAKAMPKEQVLANFRDVHLDPK